MKNEMNLERNVENLPKTFCGAKKEFERNFAFQLARCKSENKHDELENYALLFELMQDFNSFVERHEEEVAVKLKELMDEEKTDSVLLGKYGLKVEYDSELSWLTSDYMKKRDWFRWDESCNRKYLEDKRKMK